MDTELETFAAALAAKDKPKVKKLADAIPTPSRPSRASLSRPSSAW